MDDGALLDLLGEAAAAVRAALDDLDDWGPLVPGGSQHHSDLVADAAALEVLIPAGMGVLSEESALHHPERPLLAVVDPVDGSTNASRGVPWYATSLCVLDDRGPRAALVVNQATGSRFEAVRGGGARWDGTPLRASGVQELSEAVVAVSGWPAHHLGWRQLRVFGAAALDLCLVAAGAIDAYLDCANGHMPWDYLGGLLVCLEAGAVVADARGRDLVTRDPRGRRAPVAAASPALLRDLLAALGAGDQRAEDAPGAARKKIG